MPGAGLARGWSLPQTPVARVAKLRSNIGVSCAPPIAMAEEGGKSSCWEKRSSSSSGEKVVWTFFSGHTLLWGPSWFRLWKNLPQNSHVMVFKGQVQTKKQFQLCRLGFQTASVYPVGAKRVAPGSSKPMLLESRILRHTII